MYTSFEYCQLVHSIEGSLSRHARILDCTSNQVWSNVTITIWTSFSVEMRISKCDFKNKIKFSIWLLKLKVFLSVLILKILMGH